MLNEVLSWVGGGLALVFLYIVISNTLWLLFGSRLIQCLPGVNINGFRGTIKIAIMFILSAIGTLRWTFKYVYMSVARRKPMPVFSEEVGRMIQQGAKMMGSRKSSHPKA
jgi:hypothetical protein